MVMDELNEIKKFWFKRYPYIDIRLWHDETFNKFFGQFSGINGNQNFQANTIGELIAEGENVLRRCK